MSKVMRKSSKAPAGDPFGFRPWSTPDASGQRWAVSFAGGPAEGPALIRVSGQQGKVQTFRDALPGPWDRKRRALIFRMVLEVLRFEEDHQFRFEGCKNLESLHVAMARWRKVASSTANPRPAAEWLRTVYPELLPVESEPVAVSSQRPKASTRGMYGGRSVRGWRMIAKAAGRLNGTRKVYPVLVELHAAGSLSKESFLAHPSLQK
jgi:hypothetical protein